MNELIGLISIGLGIVSYGVYLRYTMTGRIKPHAMSWLIWSLLNGVVCFEQLVAGAGAGAWVTGFASLINFLIFLVALRKGRRQNTLFDWICLALVLVLLASLRYIADPNVAVLCAVVIFLAGFVPTHLKARRNIYEESALSFGLNGLKFFLSLLALEAFTFATALYPLTLFVVESTFALYLLIERRRRGLPLHAKHPVKKKRIVKKRKYA